MSLGPGIGKKARGSKLFGFRARLSLSDKMVFRKILSYYAENKSHDVDNCPDYSSIFSFRTSLIFIILNFTSLNLWTPLELKIF